MRLNFAPDFLDRLNDSILFVYTPVCSPADKFTKTLLIVKAIFWRPEIYAEVMFDAMYWASRLPKKSVMPKENAVQR